MEETKAGSITEKILTRMEEHMTCENASAPNAIAEDIAEMLTAEGYDDHVVETITSGVFELASALVLNIGEYL